MAGVTIEGLPELRRKFAELSDKQQRGVLRTGIRAGAQLVVREARKNVHDVSGNLRKGMKAKVSVKQGGVTEASIGWDKKIAPHGHLVELGHVQIVGPRSGAASQRRSGKAGPKQRAVGHVPAHPFLRPALLDHEQQIIDVIAKNFRKHIDRVAAGQGAAAAGEATEAA